MVGSRASAGTRKIPGSTWVDPPSALQIRPLRKPLRLLHLIAEEGEKAWLVMRLKVGACGVGDGQRGGPRVGQGRMARQEAED